MRTRFVISLSSNLVHTLALEKLVPCLAHPSHSPGGTLRPVKIGIQRTRVSRIERGHRPGNYPARFNRVFAIEPAEYSKDSFVRFPKTERSARFLSADEAAVEGARRASVASSGGADR
jgi:hypothetical protein